VLTVWVFVGWEDRMKVFVAYCKEHDYTNGIHIFGVFSSKDELNQIPENRFRPMQVQELELGGMNIPSWWEYNQNEDRKYINTLVKDFSNLSEDDVPTVWNNLYRKFKKLTGIPLKLEAKKTEFSVLEYAFHNGHFKALLDLAEAELTTANALKRAKAKPQPSQAL
jgi:hypothetical protein